MGVEYDLNDPARGESFDFGKGWYSDEPPNDGPWPWKPLRSRAETLEYVTTHFHFLKVEGHSDECRAHQSFGPGPCAVKWCPFNDGDPEYASAFADKLWTWLEGRDQSQLDITDDCSNDDIHCRADEYDEHDELCENPHHRRAMQQFGERHFFVTGSRYLGDYENGRLAPRSKRT